MAASTSITVSHSGVEKRVWLCEDPGIELSDEAVASLETDLHNQLRVLFKLANGAEFYLHEAESSRVMSRESFREYASGFPSHWYLVSTRGAKDTTTIQPVVQEDFLAGLATPPATPPSDDSSELPLSDDDEEPALSLTDLTALPEQSYSSSSVSCDSQGNFGLSLRHFIIQSDSPQRVDTPLDEYDRPLSRTSVESTDLKLSTTFVHHVTPGGVASRAGLEHGQVVHMINGVSVIRSSVNEIRKLLVNCGDKLTLLTLPKEHDDLQFLYPRYTYGPSGEYSTKDGLVSAIDIEAVRGTPLDHVTTPMDHVTSPPSGMMAFDDVDYASQDNSQSCDHRLPRKHSDVLIEGSLQDIENSAPPTTSEGHAPPVPPRSYKKSTPDSSSSVTMPWYNSDEQDLPASDQIIMEEPGRADSRPPPLPVRVRTRSNTSLETKAQVFNASSQSQETSSPSNMGTPLTNSMTALDSLSNNSHARSRSTDLGRFKIKRKGDKSLEGLTRIASDGLQKRLSIKPQTGEVPSPEPARPDQQLGNGRSASTTSLGKKPGRHGYQHKRKELHSRSKSKPGLANTEPEATPPRVPVRRPHTYSEVDIITTPDASPQSQGGSPQTPPTVGGVSPARPQRGNRPLSAIEHASLGPKPPNTVGPFTLEPPKKTPIFKTRSIGDQSFREVNIEEAIAASQADHTPSINPAHYSGQRSLSIDAGTLMDISGGKRKSRKRLSGKDLLDGSPETGLALGLSPTLRKLSGEVLNTMGIPREPQTNIQCHGVLTKKQDLLASGKRASDRSWRSYYAVLSSNTISFYRDRKEAGLRVPTEEPSILVLPSKTTVAKNSKKKFVFRVVTGDGAVFLLQASDASSLKRWVGTIQDINGGPPSPELNRSMEGGLAPPSPGPGRRSFSPSHKTNKKKDDKRLNIRQRMKIRLKRNKDEPDYSSFVTFGVPLEDCPVSLDNKRVPLVVEYCVRMVEAHGLDVEGIYRKPGLVSHTNHLSSEMDKGIYESTIEDLGDIHIVGSLLKKFFKDLPDSLIPESAHASFIQCARVPDEDARLGRLVELVQQLPMAHYHTLAYLMEHLKKITAHSEQNLMTYRNVALVFGPTLVRGTQDFLSTMNESYAIVELLCRHVEQVFETGMCAEEVVAQTTADEVTEPSRGSPLVREPPSVRDHERPTTNGHSWDRHRSIDSGVGSPGDNRSPDPNKTRRLKQRPHLYEDVERHRHPIRHNYEEVQTLGESRTSSWVNKHSETGWGMEETSKREGVGSLWAAQNRHTRKPSTGKKTESLERDFSSSYSTSSRSYSQRPRAASTLPANPTSPVKRRISYVTAMEPEERFTSSEYVHNSPRFPSVGSAAAYQSLQRQRQHSRSESARMNDAKAMLLRGAPSKTSAIQRTRSHGASNRTRDGLVRTPSGQLESNFTIKQSLL